MAKVSSSGSSQPQREIRPALTPDGREQQMIALAVDLAEKQLRDGTASSQVITHYLKLGSSNNRIEKDILIKQRDLISAKTESLRSQRNTEELYSKAIKAMQLYGGHPQEEPENDGY